MDVRRGLIFKSSGLWMNISSAAEGYTVHHTAGWPRLVDWGAALQWLAGILPASFAGRLLTFRSHDHGKQTLCSRGNESKTNRKD